jgi:1-deoxy-D-xylulose-5-phosphate reductoisomerase
VLNAANEVAVEAFLAKRIAFLAIASLVEATLDERPDLASVAPSSIDDVLAVDGESRLAARTLLDRFASQGPRG